MATAAAPTKFTERDMLDRLNVRYGKTYRNGGYVGREFTQAEHVPIGMGYDRSRIADFMAIRNFRSRGVEHIRSYHERRLELERLGNPAPTATLIGHEIKVSRSDWLSELRDPEKAETWKRHCHEWYLVVSDLSIVGEGELPEDWGLMTKHGPRTVRMVKPAPRLSPVPLSMDQTAAIARAVMQTETRLALAVAGRTLSMTQAQS